MISETVDCELIYSTFFGMVLYGNCFATANFTNSACNTSPTPHYNAYRIAEMSASVPCSTFAVTWKSGEKKCKHCGMNEEDHTESARLKYEQSVGKDEASLLRQQEIDREQRILAAQRQRLEDERHRAYVAEMLALYKVGMKVFVRLGNSHFEGSIVSVNEADETCDCEVHGSVEARMPFCALQPMDTGSKQQVDNR